MNARAQLPLAGIVGKRRRVPRRFDPPAKVAPATPGPVLPGLDALPGADERGKAHGNRYARRGRILLMGRVRKHIRNDARLANEPQWVREVLAAIASTLRADRACFASTEFVRKRVKDRTGFLLSHGKTWDMLLLGEKLGYWSWPKQHVTRHHGKADPGNPLRAKPIYFRIGQRAALAAIGKHPPGVNPIRRLSCGPLLARLLRGQDPERPGTEIRELIEPELLCPEQTGVRTPGSIEEPINTGPPSSLGDAARRVLAALAK